MEPRNWDTSQTEDLRTHSCVRVCDAAHPAEDTVKVKMHATVTNLRPKISLNFARMTITAARYYQYIIGAPKSTASKHLPRMDQYAPT